MSKSISSYLYLKSLPRRTLIIFFFFITCAQIGSVDAETGTPTNNFPSISSVSPNSGPSGMAQEIIIKGNNFQPGVKVGLISGGIYLTSSYAAAGQAKAVYGFGKYLFVAEGTSGLEVIDINKPHLPTSVGLVDTKSEAGGIFVAENYVYVAAGESGLQIIDITTPSTPVLTATYDTPGQARNVYVAGNYAYVAAGSGLQIIDIATPSAPVLTATYDTPGQAMNVYVAGNYVYMTDGFFGLKIIDVEHPDTPVLVGSNDTPGNSQGIFVTGNFAYVADGYAGLQVLDITNPHAPMLAGNYNTPGNASGIYVSGSHAYVSDGESGLQVIDISQPTAPTLAGIYKTAGAVSNIFVSGNHAYLVGETTEIRIVDISSPAFFAGSYDTPDRANNIYVSGKYAFIADGESGLQILDINNPKTPKLISAFGTSDWANDVFVSGKYAYVACGDSGIIIVNISDPSAPKQIGSYDTAGLANGVFVSDKYAFIADGDSGLQIIDISDPSSPNPIASYDSPGWANSVFVSENLIFLADWNSGLEVIDFSTPTAPNLIGSYIAENNDGNARGVYVSGNYAFVAYDSSGLRILDIIDPSHPSLIASDLSASQAQAVHISGNYAYVSDGRLGIKVIDISHPASPSIIGSYDTPDFAFDTVVSGNYAFVADGAAGMRTINLSSLVIDATFVDGNIITASLPPDLFPGPYHVLVSNPDSGEFRINNGYTVTPSFTIMVEKPINGKISPSAEVIINSGSSQEFKIIPVENFHISDVLIDDLSFGALSSFSFTNITDNHSISAVFAPDTQVIIINVEAGQTILLTSSDNYHIEDVMVDGVSVGPVETYTSDITAGTHTITAEFSITKHNLTFNEISAAGVITNSSSVVVNEGASTSITITVNNAHPITEVLIDGTSVENKDVYSFENITSDHLIEVKYTDDTSSNDSGHTIFTTAEISSASLKDSEGDVPSAETAAKKKEEAPPAIATITIKKGEDEVFSKVILENLSRKQNIQEENSQVSIDPGDGKIKITVVTKDEEANISPAGEDKDRPGENQTLPITEGDKKILEIKFSNTDTASTGSGKRVDGFDLITIAASFGLKEGDPKWNAAADVNKDGAINGADLSNIVLNFGKINL